MKDKKESLSELIDRAGTDDPEVVWELRKQHEEDTGIPMEEDDLGHGEAEIAAAAFPEIVQRLDEIE